MVDDLPRVPVSNWDYRQALEGANDDLVLLDWDIAIEGPHLDRFMDRALAEPDRVRVAPYRISSECWVHRIALPEGPQPVEAVRRIRELTPAQFQRLTTGLRWVTGPQDAECTHIGFGMVYLPLALIRAFLRSCAGAVSDTSFSDWHWRTVGERIPIEWGIPVVHLHVPRRNSVMVLAGSLQGTV